MVSVEARASARWFSISRTRVARSLFVWIKVSRCCWRVVYEGCWLERAEIRDGSLRMVWRSVVLGLRELETLLSFIASQGLRGHTIYRTLDLGAILPRLLEDRGYMAAEDYWDVRPDVRLSGLAARLVQWCFAGCRVDWLRGCWVLGVVEEVCRGS